MRHSSIGQIHDQHGNHPTRQSNNHGGSRGVQINYYSTLPRLQDESTVEYGVLHARLPLGLLSKYRHQPKQVQHVFLVHPGTIPRADPSPRLWHLTKHLDLP